MPAVGDLLHGASTVSNPLSRTAAAITTDNLHGRMRLQPGCGAISGAFWDEVQNAMTFQVDDDRAVALPSPQRPIIDTYDGRSDLWWCGKGTNPAIELTQGGAQETSSEICRI